jgi:signal transduction histidine kinase
MRERAPERAVPLIAVRPAALAGIPWRRACDDGGETERNLLEAFKRITGRLVRAGDLLGYDREAAVLAVVLTAPSRAAMPVVPDDCRAIAERVRIALAGEVSLRAEAGWSVVKGARDRRALLDAAELAFARGNGDRSRRALLATVGHELRTPLCSIRGSLETLLERRPGDREEERFLKTARREALRMQRMLDQMMEYSLLDLSVAGTDEDCDLAHVVRSAARAVRPIAERRRTAIAIDVRRGIHVLLERDVALRICVNLMENAIKHGRHGGRIFIRCARSGGVVELEVHDDGPGLEQGQETRLFAFGERGHRVRAAGNGLGLGIVAALVERAGGNVRAGRSPLGGARFEVRLPAARRRRSP